MKLLTPLCFWSLSVSCLPLVPVTRLETADDRWDADAIIVVKEVCQSSAQVDASLIVITRESFSGKVEALLRGSRGAAVFEAAPNTSRLDRAVASAHQIRWTSWNVVVILVSDDPALLADFALQARESRLLVSATRLIVVTRRLPHRLHLLHKVLSLTNSLLIELDATVGMSRAAGWAVLPYKGPDVAPLRVASWTVDRGLILHHQLFWDKFTKFTRETSLLVAMEQNHGNKVVMQPDPTVAGGMRLFFKGFMVSVLEYLAQGLNFSFSYQRPPDGAWGAKMSNGSFSGMVGQVHREDVNFGLGPFSIDAARHEVIDFTWPISFVTVKVFAGRGSPEVNSWAFLLPLAPWVWAALLASLLLLSIATFLLSAIFSQKGFSIEGFAKRQQTFISIMLRQSVWVGGGGWWWESVVLGMWMLMTMVLTRSYEGTLTSLLAVRNMPQPYQTLKAVIDDHAVGMIWHKQGAVMQAVMDATSGIFCEVKASEEEGRLTKLPLFSYASVVDEIIAQRKVIVDYDVITTVIRSNHFSRTGRCDFYFGREHILSHPISLISQKDSPLIPVFNKRITSMNEAGLYMYWRVDMIPNSSACERVPTKITVSSTLSLRQCWAMLVMLAGGAVVGVAALFMEVVLV